MADERNHVDRRSFMRNVGGAGFGLYAAGIAARQDPAKAAQEKRKEGAASKKTGSAKPAKSTFLGGGIDRAELQEALQMACEWLAGVAQMKGEHLTEGRETNSKEYPYTNWKGAIRGEYFAGQRDAKNDIPPRVWSFFGPIWHTGQAVRALTLAHGCLGRAEWLDAAKRGADFILRHQVSDKNSPDYGAILAFEDHADVINTSAVLECCDGLFELSKTSGDRIYARQAAEAVGWVVRTLYKGDGLFHDGFIPGTRQKTAQGWKSKAGIEGRPLLDDGVLLIAALQTKDDRLRRVFYEVADTLLANEEPAGNWINYVPCSWKKGSIHPRHAFWWGRPMWMAYKDSGNEKYRACFNRACEWYVRAMRRDGGLFRNTYSDFTTDSFGHATSGVGAACMMFHDQAVHLGNGSFNGSLVQGLRFIMNMQVRKAADPNMQGVIIEKVLPPDGTDACPWQIRDLGTIFFVAAASLALRDMSG